MGADAEDKFHMVEIEGLTYDGKSTKVPLAVLKPSIMPSVSAHHKAYKFIKFPRCRTTSLLNTVVKIKPGNCRRNLKTYLCFLPPFLTQMSLGGFEIMPPVTFRLQVGSGPVHISGQHFVSEYFDFCISSLAPPNEIVRMRLWK